MASLCPLWRFFAGDGGAVKAAALVLEPGLYVVLVLAQLR